MANIKPPKNKFIPVKAVRFNSNGTVSVKVSGATAAKLGSAKRKKKAAPKKRKAVVKTRKATPKKKKPATKKHKR